jgi:hypothetical protein
MAPIDPDRFANQFSALSNALQDAVLLAGRRAVEARVETADAEQLYAAVSRAVEAARQLRVGADHGPEKGGAR